MSGQFVYLGFTDPRRPHRRSVTRLIATVTLAMTLAVAVTAVSVGIALARAPGTVRNPVVHVDRSASDRR